MKKSNNLFNKRFLKKYFGDFSWVATGMFMAMAIDFIFYILAGRLMTTTEFGYFGVLTSLYYIFLRSPFRALEITSKKIQAEGIDSMDSMGRKSILLGVSIFVLFLIFSNPISVILGVPPDTIAVLSLVFPLGYLLPVLVGKIQGEKNFSLYGKYEFSSSFLAFSAIVLVYLGFGAKGAVTMFIVEILTGFLIIYYSDSFNLGSSRFKEYKLLKDSFMFIVAVHVSFSLDLLAVQHFFSSEITGLYNAVAVFGKGLFFGAVAVNRSVFPKLVSDREDRIRNLQLSALIVVLGGIFSAIFFLLFGDTFVSYTFGSNYIPSLSYAPHYMIMISGISLTSLMASYCLSTDKGYIKVSILMPFTQFVLIAFFHQTVLHIIYSTLTASILTASIFYLIIWRSRS